MKCLLLFLSLYMSTLRICAQHIIVTGTVTDARDKEPLIGAVVRRLSSGKDGKAEVVTTDLDGRYTIEVLPNESLKIFYLGYKEMEVKVDDRTNIDIKMKAENDELTPSCFGIPSFSHSIMAIASYSKDGKFGYGLDYQAQYSYLWPCTVRQKIINMFQLGLAFKDIDPSNSEYLFNPYMSFSPLGISAIKYKYNKIFLYPYLDAGYYVDTNFSKIGRKGFSYGGGIRISLKTIRVFGRRRNLLLSTGYSAYKHHHSNNHFYLGVQLSLTGNKGYVFI